MNNKIYLNIAKGFLLWYALLIIFLLFTITTVQAQSRLVLQRQSRPSKQKQIKPDRSYYIKTSDTTYYSLVIGFSDTSLSVAGWTKVNRDTSYTYTYKQSKHKDTTITIRIPLYAKDTIAIAFADIQMIKKDWFKKRSWLEPFAWIALGAGLGVPLLPVAAIDSGAAGVKDWLTFEGILLGVAAPPLFIGTRKTKYDLIKKWIIKTE